MVHTSFVIEGVVVVVVICYCSCRGYRRCRRCRHCRHCRSHKLVANKGSNNRRAFHRSDAKFHATKDFKKKNHELAGSWRHESQKKDTKDKN